MSLRHPAVTSPARPLIARSPNPRDLDLNDLVPAQGRIDAVWYVPAGKTAPEVVVGWSYRGRNGTTTPSLRRYALTVWHPDHITEGSARWNPHTLFRGSPFPFGSSSVRTADVTRDGHDDLLVTMECDSCNHAAATASVFADDGAAVRRIYGDGFLDGSKGEHIGVRGRVIVETAWGASNGLLWFDEPRGGGSVCCPAYRLRTFLRRQDGKWRVVRAQRLSPERDTFMGQAPVPGP